MRRPTDRKCYEEASNILVREEYPTAYDESGLDIVSQPDIEIVQIEKGKEFIFEATVAVKPDVELGEYKGVTVTKVDVDVTGYELLGSEVILYYELGGAHMSAKVESTTPARLGDHVTLALNPEKIHVFDHDTELTITN